MRRYDFGLKPTLKLAQEMNKELDLV